MVPPPPWDRFLREVDAKLTTGVTLHCIGGFALTILYDLPRPTGDLDYNSVTPQSMSEKRDEIAGQASRLASKYKVCVHSTGIVDLPDEYETRLSALPLGFERLVIAVPDPYDLVLSKLTRNSPKDRADVKFLAEKRGLSWENLMARFDKEMRPWIPNLERHLTTLNAVWRDYFGH